MASANFLREYLSRDLADPVSGVGGERIPQGAIDAIRAGRRGVHIETLTGRVLEAVGVVDVDGDSFVATRCLNGEPGPKILARYARALARTYEAGE